MDENPAEPGNEGVSVPAPPGWDWRVKQLSPALDSEFRALHGWHVNGTPFDEDGFRAAAFAYFDKRSSMDANMDPFFDNFTHLALPRSGTPIRWTSLWEWALDIAHSWESLRGLLLHKGTGYYFAAVRDIVLGDLDRGFLYMHQAAAEDIRSTGTSLPDRPAVWFITLDARNPNQAYHERVQQYEARLDGLLSDYRSSRRGDLTLDKLRRRFMRHPELLDAITTIGHSVARVTRLGDPATREIRRNAFAHLLLSQVSLELCLVLEDLLRRRISGVPGEPTLGKLARRYPARHGIRLTAGEWDDLSGLFKASTFDATIASLLDGRQLPGFSRRLSGRETDLAVAYAIRNKAAHGLERPAAASAEFERIIPRIFYAVFAAFEGLYR